MDLRWEDRQRAFQAKVLTEGIGEDVAIGVRPYRTFLGASSGTPPPAGSRIERALLVVIAGTAICCTLVLIGGPKSIVALLAGLTGGIAVFAGLAGPDPRVRHVMHEPRNPGVQFRAKLVRAIGCQRPRRLALTQGQIGVVAIDRYTNLFF